MKFKTPVIVAAVIFGVLFLFFTLISFHRFYILQIFYYDFGIFARIIWLLSRFQPPFLTHVALGRIFFLGDHFNPSLVLLSPLFWLTSDLKILLVEQALVTTFQGVMIFLIGRRFKFSYLTALIFAIVHLFFAGTLNPLVTDWHPEPTASFFLLLFFYLFLFAKKRRWFYISALIFLGFKESNALTLSFLLLWLWFLAPKKRKEVGFLLIIAVVWFSAATKLIIPYFSRRPYFYTPELPRTIGGIISNFFNHPAKMTLIRDSLGSFGFLPFLSFTGLIPIIGELAIRFVPTKSFFQSYTLSMHYNVYLGVFLSLATMAAVTSVKQWLLPRYRNRAVVFLMLYLFGMSILMARKVTFSPINLAVSSVFWQELGQKKSFFSVLPQIPKKGTVLSQNNILPHLVGRRDEVYLFSDSTQDVQADIAIFDLTPGNPNNFWPSNEEKIKLKIRSLLRDNYYKRLLTKDENLFIFVKK